MLFVDDVGVPHGVYYESLHSGVQPLDLLYVVCSHKDRRVCHVFYVLFLRLLSVCVPICNLYTQRNSVQCNQIVVS